MTLLLVGLHLWGKGGGGGGVCSTPLDTSSKSSRFLGDLKLQLHLQNNEALHDPNGLHL